MPKAAPTSSPGKRKGRLVKSKKRKKVVPLWKQPGYSPFWLIPGAEPITRRDADGRVNYSEVARVASTVLQR